MGSILDETVKGQNDDAPRGGVAIGVGIGR
jgi:hypothetical protein